MKWNKGGEVIVRLPGEDGKVIELTGDIQDINIEYERDVTPIYQMGHSEPTPVQSQHRTRFTIRGIAHERRVVDPPKDKVVKPSRWADIMDEDF